MNSFCCASPVPVSSAAAAAAAANSSSASSSSAHMPPPSSLIAAPNGHRHRPSDLSSSSSRLIRAASLHEFKINDIVGNGISGILHKWVNYGKGWRPRWFVLKDGVLSYYKIHGPDRIEVTQETEKGAKVIGEESARRISRRSKSNGHHHPQLQRKPLGEVHLKVSSIRESKSDDKRFSIFTGTKRLHVRAETREDRAAWLESLQAVKEMFQRISKSELMAPMDNIVVSTEKLRQRLKEEGVSEQAIQDSEQIMRTEFTALQNQLVILKQKQARLVETLGQLETEKVDLENTLVDEIQRQSNEYGSTSRPRNEKSSGMSMMK